MYNKNMSRKINDKKVLHKVGKNWKVISVALLMAIGGGAVVATHANASANADSINNNNTQTENVISPSVQSTANSLEAPAKVQMASSAPSAKAQSANSNKQSAPSSVAYDHNDGGSAASYNQKATSDKADYMPAENIVKDYVNSLNNRYEPEVSGLQKNINSYGVQQNNDQSLANSYSATVKAGKVQPTLNSLASSANMTPSEFADSVQTNKFAYANNVKQGKSLDDQLSAVNSDAQLINNIDTNSATSEAYKLSAVSADDALTIANAKVNADKAEVSGYNTAKVGALNNSAAYSKLELGDKIALINSGVDANYTNSLATKLGFSNSISASQDISSAAKALDANSKAKINFTNASGSSVPLDQNDKNLSQVLSDTNAMTQFAHAKSLSGNTELTNSINSASDALATDESVASSDANTARIADILGNHPTMANLFGTVAHFTVNKHVDPKSAQNSLAASGKALATQLKSANGIKKAAGSAVASAAQSLAKVVNGKPQLSASAQNEIASMQVSASNTDKSAENTINSLETVANSFGTNNSNVNRMNSEVTTGNYTSSASSLEGNLLNPASYAMASAAVKGMNASAISSEASSVGNSLASENASSASYDNATDANVILAPYYAKSYAADAKSDASNLSNAQKALSNFYLNHSDKKYANALNATKTDQKNYVKDSVLAYAYGVHAFNHGPKFITMTKGCLLHNSVDFSKGHINVVHHGTQFKVLGIGFAKNGDYRYVVENRGKKGFITADPNFVRATYLPANKQVKVTVLHRQRAYRNNGFHHAVRTYRAGTKLEGTVVSEDNNIGGFTRIRLNNGLYVTANTAFVRDDTPAAPAAKKSSNNNNDSQKVNLVNF